MLRIGIISALVLGLNPGIRGTALAADKTPSPCKPLAKLWADFDAKTHFATLTPGNSISTKASTLEARLLPMACRQAKARCSRLMTVLRMALFFGPAAHSRVGCSQSARSS
jgi:hypothetical protein